MVLPDVTSPRTPHWGEPRSLILPLHARCSIGLTVPCDPQSQPSGEPSVDFDQILDQAIEMLQRRGRLTYRTLKRQFELDDGALEDLKFELIEGQQIATDEKDTVLVWTGNQKGISQSTSETPISMPTQSEQEPASYTPPYLAEKILTSRSALEGERKQVTVLFADIKGSTELIEDLDPEEAQRLLDPALHHMMDAVHRFEGTVNQVLGDGIMALFGAPLAHEDHAARACYAALAMQNAMRAYTDEVRRTQGMSMQIRVGLNSGEVVVRTIGNDLHMDYSAVGQTTHLAARMEQLATPGSIMLTAETLRLVEGLVQIQSLGPVAVKGITEPVDVFELTGASTVRRRLQAAVARGLTQFVGRDTEIEIRNQALEQAGAGHGQMVAAVGEAGVGKSRLAYEFVHSHRTQGWLVLESASVSYGKATPYFPVIDLLKRYVHVEDGDDVRTIRAKVTGHILTLDDALQDAIPALLSLLDAVQEDSPFLQLDPLQRRHRTLDGLKRILLRESQVQPLVLVFEDLHWHDSESQALLDSLIESLPTAQLLLLVNYRPEYTHDWGSKVYYTLLHLDPLPPESAEAFLAALLGNDTSLASLKSLLTERTDGNPFFLEESVRTLVETQVLAGEPGAYYLIQDLPSIHVPPTVQAVLAARIDRIPQDEKRLLQTAAVIGTEVPFSLLQAIVETPNDALYPSLAHLQAAEFLYETSLFPERVYTFKHALTHDVAYHSLLQERRRALHARIAEALEGIDRDREAEQIKRLAHHAFRGEVWEKAVSYYKQAGAKAIVRSAYQEAQVCFEQALAVLKSLLDTRVTQEQFIDLQLHLRGALHPLGKAWPHLDRLHEAEPLAKALDDPRRKALVARDLGAIYWWGGMYEHARAYCQQAMHHTSNDDDFQLSQRYLLGLIDYSEGAYRSAIEYLSKGLTTDDDNRIDEVGTVSGIGSITVFTHAVLSMLHAECGTFEEGFAHGTKGIRLSEVIDHLYCRLVASFCVGQCYLRKGEFDKAIPLLRHGLALCQSGNLPRFMPEIAALLGASLASTGQLTEALPLLEEATERGTAMHYMSGQALRVVFLSEAYCQADRIDEALAQAQLALQLTQDYQELGNQGYALRVLGDIVMHNQLPDVYRAKTHYQQALTLAQELGMRPLQAHCHRGLGTLYSQTGQTEQARAELSTAIEMYREMEMTFWLPETEAALSAVEGKV